MDKQTLKTISYQQTNRFFQSYSMEWRSIQIASIEKQILQRYSYFTDILDAVKYAEDDSPNDSLIAQQVSNGLFFEAISIAVQSVEDLFALLYAGKTPLKFIAKVITYQAGKITNFISEKHNDENIATLFYIPLFDQPGESEEDDKQLAAALSLLQTWFLELKDFYRNHLFFYNQYKHGLSVVFKALVDFTPDMVQKHKMDPYTKIVQVFDNISITKAEKIHARFNKAIMMPVITKEINANLSTLINDDNFLRFVKPLETPDIRELKKVVAKARLCIEIFSFNLMHALGEADPIRVALPHNLEGTKIIAEFNRDRYSQAINKKIFI